MKNVIVIGVSGVPLREKQPLLIVKAIEVYTQKEFVALLYLLQGISILDNMFIIAFRSLIK